MNGDFRATALGFGSALVVLAVLFIVVGVERILSALSKADPVFLAVIPVILMAWILVWSLLLRVVVGVLDGQLSVGASVLIHTASLFANNITPFGQAGGEPLIAYLIANAIDSEYERGLAVIASIDAIHFVPSITFASLGIVYFGVTSALTETLESAALAVVMFLIGIPLAGTIGWRYRIQIETAIARLLTRAGTTLARVVPDRTPPEYESVRRRVDGFFGAVERVATDRERLAIALCLSAVGWVLLSGVLWTCLFTLGHTVSFLVVLLVVPIGGMASVTPLPGGLGGIETVQAALLVPLTGIDPATAVAAVVLHRAAVYWVPTIIGGGVMSYIGTQSY